MKNKVFRKTLVVSFLGHLTIFGMFSLSFGPRLPSATDYARVYFLGRILSSADFFKSSVSVVGNKITENIKILRLPRGDKIEMSTLTPYYFKPLAVVYGDQPKEAFKQDTGPALTYKLPEQSIMFYPQLPYYFQLYFKDRQQARIELEFNIINDGDRNIILVKRKISSGNLEADLLSMRYISHYLSVQQAGFAKNNWQTIKIELSAKNSEQ